MKIKILFYIVVCIVGTLVFTSCDDYLDVNTNPNQSTTSGPNLQLSSAQLYIGNAIGDRLFSQTNIWCQYNTGGPGVALGDWDQNTMNSTDANQVFDNLYRSSSNLSYLQSGHNGYKAIGKILNAYNAQVCADLFGDIPFTEALKGDINDGSIFNPKYDNAKEVVYPGIEKLLIDAIALLGKVGATDVVEGDLMYAGDLGKWNRFANSLLLKVYTRIGDKTKLGALVASGDFMATNDDNAKIAYAGNSKGSNPFWSDAKSTALGNFYVASKTTMDFLQGNSDPRISLFFNPGAAGHLGLKHGDVQNAPATASFSRPNGALATAGGLIFGPKIPVILMTVWEVKFLLAEAAARGFAGGDAKALYEAAMYANSDYLGSDSASMSKYISEKGAFDPSNAIKSIAVQKWASMNNLQPVESWIETRRFDNASNPFFTSPGGLFAVPTENVLGGNKFPSILFYPETEQSLNKNFVAQHSLTDKVFWD